MALLAITLCVTITISGCSFASFTQKVEQDLPVVLQIVTNLTTIVAPQFSAPIQAVGALAMTSLQLACGNPAPGATKCDATSLVGQYQAATDPAVKTSLLQKIQASLLTVQAHLTDMLKLASGLPPADAAAITVGVALAVATITAILSMIPASASLSHRAAAAALGVEPPSRSQLVKQFNQAVGQRFPNAVVR
jgi:hypothetical protein